MITFREEKRDQDDDMTLGDAARGHKERERPRTVPPRSFMLYSVEGNEEKLKTREKIRSQLQFLLIY